MDLDKFNTMMVNALANVEGIIAPVVVRDEDRVRILICEEDAERQSLMGLGKVINTGVRKILKCDAVYGALTQMNFDWGCHQASLVLKKEEELVGEEIRDEARLAQLRTEPNVWFMHKNFVIYKDRINFPQDVMAKICHFEIPALQATWFDAGSAVTLYSSAIVATPSILCDVFLKEHYFKNCNCDEHGMGTLLMGVDLCESPTVTPSH